MSRIGVDIIEVPRIEACVRRWGDGFLDRVYTDREKSLYRDKPASLAARFAAKEAVVKVLGAKHDGVCWRHIEILTGKDGHPTITLHGKAKECAERLGLGRFSVSLSHSRNNAVAFVIAEAAE